jgi:hypothetical protein
MPMCDGIYINSIFFLSEFNSVWVFWIVLFVEKGFLSARRALSEWLIINKLLFEMVVLIIIIAS